MSSNSASEPDYKAMREEILQCKVETPADCEYVRGFFLEATDTQSELYDHYHAYGWPIEKDLMKKISAFDQEYELAKHDLKLLRRFLLKRYAFLRVFKIDCLLHNRGVSWFWLAKDYAVPRVGLSLLVGFGLILGASRLFEALAEIASKPVLAGSLIAACIALVVGLIYLIVRDELGSQHGPVKLRSLGIFGIAIIWTTLELLGVYVISRYMAHDVQLAARWNMNLLHTAETGAVALVFAVLTQFFFSKNGSMAEPL